LLKDGNVVLLGFGAMTSSLQTGSPFVRLCYWHHVFCRISNYVHFVVLEDYWKKFYRFV
jgi:hypothetical protein